MKTTLIGITGGIGSGKTIVSRIITTIGYPVYNADNEAGKILESDPEVVAEVKKLIGEKAYISGIPNRAFIASVVFDNNEKLKQLNAIIHPGVQSHFMKCVDRNSASGLLFKEAAILFESGSYKAMQYVIAVTAPVKLRISRVKNRDNKSEDQIKQVIDKQLSESELIAKSDYVIVNDEEQLILPKVISIIDDLKKKNQ